MIIQSVKWKCPWYIPQNNFTQYSKMRRSRRNALALGEKEDGSPEPEAQSAVEEVFGVVPSADSVVLDNVESGSERSLAHLTNEQITGNIKCLEAKRSCGRVLNNGSCKNISARRLTICENEWMNERMNKWTSERVNQWTNNERMNEQTDGRTDGQTKKRMKRHAAFESLSGGQYTEYWGFFAQLHKLRSLRRSFLHFHLHFHTEYCYQLRSIDETRLYTYLYEQAIHALFWHKILPCISSLSSI